LVKISAFREKCVFFVSLLRFFVLLYSQIRNIDDFIKVSADGGRQEIVEKMADVNSQERFAELTLLKRSTQKYPESPDQARLEVFQNVYRDRDYEINFDCPEFTSLCPVTGQPDFGHIAITYIPDEYCIESKSLKIFLYAHRTCNTFHEEAVNSILTAVVTACHPKWAEVVGKFNPRGGIAINVRACTGERPPLGYLSGK